jgi:ketosteroid isomerase-like protein
MRSGEMAAQDLSELLPYSDCSIRAFFSDFFLAARDDHAKFATLLHDDAVITLIGDVCDYPLSGCYRGRQQIFDLLRRIDREFERSGHKILNLVVDGDKVGMRRSVVIRHRGTAVCRLLTLGAFAVVRDGKLAELHEYVDTTWLKQILDSD